MTVHLPPERRRCDLQMSPPCRARKGWFPREDNLVRWKVTGAGTIRDEEPPTFLAWVEQTEVGSLVICEDCAAHRWCGYMETLSPSEKAEYLS